MNGKGFTLIELMVVIAIIGFLAVISVPSFTRFVTKAKRTEAYVNLHAIYAAQKTYWVEHGTYTTVLSGENGIGWQPEGYSSGGSCERFNYTYGFSGKEGKNCFTGKLGASSHHLQQAHATKDSFLVIAVADIDNDGDLDIIGIDHNNTIVIIEDDLI